MIVSIGIVVDDRWSIKHTSFPRSWTMRGSEPYEMQAGQNTSDQFRLKCFPYQKRPHCSYFHERLHIAQDDQDEYEQEQEWMRHSCSLRCLGGMAWYGRTWHGITWYGMTLYGVARHGIAWHGMVWYGMTGHGIAWHGMAWAWGEVDRACSVLRLLWDGATHGSSAVPAPPPLIIPNYGDRHCYHPCHCFHCHHQPQLIYPAKT